MKRNIVVLDNGGSTIKAGLVNSDREPRIIPNAVIRSKGDKATYIGHEFALCKDYASLHYRLPIEKGYVVDWDAEKAVWDGIFSDQVLNVDTTESSLLITEPYFNLPNIQDVYDQLIFEEYEYHSYFRCTAASLVPSGTLFSHPGLPPPECVMVVDCGFSFTHVVPIMNGEVIWSAVKRLDVGGKLLTNHLKELVSFRQWNMMDETYIMTHIKESCCFISSDYKQDLEICHANPKHNSIIRQYVLPDLTKSNHGFIRQADSIVKESDQILVMNNESFTVPEVIFRPDDIGIQQAGLAETIAHSISLLPDDLQGMFWSNIGLIGGSTKFPGFRRRLLTELQSLVPMEWDISICEADDPVTEAYKSAYQLASRPDFATRYCVTREEYAESGSSASRRKFRDWSSAESAEKKNPQTKEPLKQKGKLREDDRPPPASSKLSRSRSRAGTASASTRRR
ncbi:actin-like protein ARP6 [Coprinopsis marcescibilis]|uniref:Actin-like protein ARP6 n=1 Tax=Coprinopsis marcescibilis TaxID=230819 RepID=A0A5C3L4Q8_COPMA|nr:actin-like protein ARP6 [Coprinopsis marcescibilis]